MALFGTYNKKSTLKAAIKQTAKARSNEGAKADQLFLSAYEGFANVVKGDYVEGDALYNWGFALLHQAKSKDGEGSIKLYLSAIAKFTFCLLVAPNHLGAAIDGGVAYMDLARNRGVGVDDELYNLAKEFFDDAERIQRGSAAYNLACIYGLRNQEDACLEALEHSKESGSLPSVEDIANDADLLRIRDRQWFVEFIETIIAGPEPEVVDKNAVAYDEEGKIVRKKTRDLRKNPEQEIDGVIYDIEGNVIRRVVDGEESPDNSVATVADKKTSQVQEMLSPIIDEGVAVSEEIVIETIESTETEVAQLASVSTSIDLKTVVESETAKVVNGKE